MSWQHMYCTTLHNIQLFFMVLFHVAGKQINLIDFSRFISVGGALYLLLPTMPEKWSPVFVERCLPLTTRAWIIYRNFKCQQRVKKTLLCLNMIELCFKDLLMQNHSGTCRARNLQGIQGRFSSLITRKYIMYYKGIHGYNLLCICLNTVTISKTVSNF